MKIIHLSDLHLNSTFKRENVKRVKRLFRYLAAQNFDHLVITGDLSDNADIEEFRLVKAILQNNGFYNSERTSIVVGNHDIFGGVQTAHDVINFPAKCSNTNHDEKVKQFINTFDELFNGAYFPDSENKFPFVKIIGGFALIGLNTVDRYSKFKNPFASNGKIDSSQFENLKKIFSFTKDINACNIIMAHHHFYHKEMEVSSSQSKIWGSIEKFTLKLRGKKKLLKLFNDNNVKLVLHGHSHEVLEYSRKNIPILNAGGSIENQNNDALSFFKIDLAQKPIGIEIHSLGELNPLKKYSDIAV